MNVNAGGDSAKHGRQKLLPGMIFTSASEAEVMWSFSFCHSFCQSVNGITDERGNGRQPNLAGMGKGWPSRSELLLAVTWIRVWIPDHFLHFIHYCGIGDSWTFASISHTIELNGRFAAYLAKWHDWRRQRNASTTFWNRSDRHPDRD